MLKWHNLDHALKRLPPDEEYRVIITPVDESKQFPNLDGYITRNRLGVAYIDSDLHDKQPAAVEATKPAAKKAASKKQPKK